MANCLVSFLGKGRKKEGGYQQLAYRFPDGTTCDKTSYFGLELRRWLKSDRLVILGTSGSMWDALFLDHDSASGEMAEGMIEAVEQNRVDQEMLEQATPLLSEKLGIPCVLRLIPFGRNKEEQVEILRLLAEVVAPGEEVVLDLTHGFRHLPMLGLLAALYLEPVRGVKVGGLYYGALEMKDDEEIAPVLELDGLLETARWIRALNSYDKDGDYGVFAELLAGNEAEEETRPLREAAFHERTGNLSLARQKLNTFLGSATWKGIDDHPIAGLFAKALKERFKPYISGTKRSHRERGLAEIYLKRKDYLRAAAFGMESRITDRVEKEGNDGWNNYDYQDREAARKELKGIPEFSTLSRLRNALAHGLVPEDKEVEKILQQEERISERLRQMFKTLFKG